MSTTDRHFTLSVVSLIVECTKDSVRVTKKNIQIFVGRLGWKWIERSEKVKGKVVYGQEPPSGESTTTECKKHYTKTGVHNISSTLKYC